MKAPKRLILNISFIIILLSLLACSCGVNLDLGGPLLPKPYVPPPPTYEQQVSRVNSNMIFGYASVILCSIGLFWYLAKRLKSIPLWIATVVLVGLAGYGAITILNHATTLLAKDLFSGAVGFGYPLIPLLWLMILMHFRKI